MKEKIKMWWWRTWTFRKDKFKIIFKDPCTLGNMYIGGDGRYIMYIGKDWFILTSIAEIELK